MKKRKNGFTLVEILAVLVIIGILLALVIPNIMGIRNKTNVKALDKKKELIEIAANIYASENRNKLMNSVGECIEDSDYCECEDESCQYVFEITTSDLIDLGYLKKESNNNDCSYINPVDNSCLDNSVIEIRFAANNNNNDNNNSNNNNNKITIVLGDFGEENSVVDDCLQEMPLTLGSNSRTYFLPGQKMIKRSEIEEIYIKKTNKVPTDDSVLGSWDVSAKKSGAVMAWYKDVDNDGLYEVYVGQKGGVIANEKSSHLFGDLTNLTKLSLTNFKTSQIKYMDGMFSLNPKLEALDLSHFDTSNVTAMVALFHSCESLKSLDLSSFDISKVKYLSQFFWGCKNLETVNLSSFNTANVESFYQMFVRCYKLKSIDISHFDTSNATNLAEMFAGCWALESIDVTNFDTSKVTSMYRMFESCSSLTEIDVSSFDTSKVTSMQEMFMGTSKIQELDISNFDTSNVSNMNNMFSSCWALKTIYVSEKFVTNKVTSTGKVFSDDFVLKGGAGTAYKYGNTGVEYAHIDGGTSNPGYFTLKA